MLCGSLQTRTVVIVILVDGKVRLTVNLDQNVLGTMQRSPQLPQHDRFAIN